MSTRKVKNAKDLGTNELIYFKGHAKATYMSDGKTVEDAINEVSNKAGGKKLMITDSGDSVSLTPNVYHRYTPTNSSSLTITLNPETDSTILNEYFIEFTTSLDGTTISLPTTITWANGTPPTFEPGITYQISIVNNLGIVTKFANN